MGGSNRGRGWGIENLVGVPISTIFEGAAVVITAVAVNRKDYKRMGQGVGPWEPSKEP